MRIRTIGAAGVLALSLGAAPALADHEDAPPGTRGEGAPGKVCKQPGVTPGSEQFRECVTAAAHERGHGPNAGNAARREARAALRAAIAQCRTIADRELRRTCVQTAKQAAKTARQQRRAALRAAIAACRQDPAASPADIRACIRAARAAARTARG